MRYHIAIQTCMAFTEIGGRMEGDRRNSNLDRSLLTASQGVLKSKAAADINT